MSVTIDKVIKNEMELEMCRFRLNSLESETNGDLPLDYLFKYLSINNKIPQ